MKQTLRWLTLFLILIVGTCCAANLSQRPAPRQTLAERLQSTTIALVVTEESPEGLRVGAFCSGVWVSRDEFITAAHCVEPEIKEMARALGIELVVDAVGSEFNFLVIEDIAGKQLGKMVVDRVRTAKVTVYDADHDLALLRVTQGDAPDGHPIAAVERAPIHVGDALHVVGHNTGFWWTYAPGAVGGDRVYKGPYDNPMHVLQVTAPVWRGNSGGGAFNAAGRLVGIAGFVNSAGPELSFFIHRDVVLKFLVDNGVDQG